jgi:hypothetical protein
MASDKYLLHVEEQGSNLKFSGLRELRDLERQNGMAKETF